MPKRMDARATSPHLIALNPYPINYFAFTFNIAFSTSKSGQERKLDHVYDWPEIKILNVELEKNSTYVFPDMTFYQELTLHDRGRLTCN